jgi:hypothetical protein
MNQVMLDLETLGTGPGCSVLSIGAVAFDVDGGLGDEFYQVVNRASCAKHGLLEEAGTLQWWGRQNQEARKVLEDAAASKVGLGGALEAFAGWLRGFDGNRVCVWGNGSDFDNAIVARCYAVVGTPMPWKFWNNRCFRTLKSLSPIEAAARTGVYHNALDDAKTQALQAVQMMRKLREPVTS